MFSNSGVEFAYVVVATPRQLSSAFDKLLLYKRHIVICKMGQMQSEYSKGSCQLIES